MSEKIITCEGCGTAFDRQFSKCPVCARIAPAPSRPITKGKASAEVYCHGRWWALLAGFGLGFLVASSLGVVL